MEFKEIFLGAGSLQYWLAYCALFLIGATITYLIKINHRTDKIEPLTWRYFWTDNNTKLFLLVLVMYVCIRVYSDIYPYVKDVAVLKYDLTQVAGTLLLGMLNQALVHWIAKRLGFIKKPKK